MGRLRPGDFEIETRQGHFNEIQAGFTRGERHDQFFDVYGKATLAAL